MKRLYGIRGAVCSENTEKSIIQGVEQLCKKVFTENMLSADDIVSIQFTVTDDLTVMNPAAALRKGNCGIDVSQCALFCSTEPEVENSLRHVIRLLVIAYMSERTSPRHIYINGAEVLRPDFSDCKHLPIK